LDLLRKFKIPKLKMVHYLTKIEALYKTRNPYHNSVHGADVAQSSYVLVTLPAFNVSGRPTQSLTRRLVVERDKSRNMILYATLMQPHLEPK